ncbi:MAG: Fe-S cluster assembly sulfur transfer protein SufU [Kiloniellales bacterium]
MLDELRDLYQEVILDHGRNPRNFGAPAHHTCLAHGNNPMCGDRVTVYLTLDDAGVIQDARFDGRGCAISTASASMMTEIVKGMTLPQMERLFVRFHQLCTGGEAAGNKGGEAEGETSDAEDEALERLQVLSGVREFPVRVKCATLPWHTLKAAVSGAGDKEVTTE